MSDLFKPLQKQIGYTFKDSKLFQLALTHPSITKSTGSNQRLEFLGDAVLDLLIAAHLFKQFPEADEGALDRMRAGIVNGRALSKIAHTIKLGNALQVSESQRRHHPKPSEAMLEDALEALIGAVYLDGGFSSAQNVINTLFAKALTDAHQLQAGNPKSRLQEWTQQQHQGHTPDYRQLEREGPDHDRHYTCAVFIQEKEIATGRGRSKKAAESAAAQTALEVLKLT
ncbi:MAG: Ribonuclease 3 [Opitutia bacterium UBA7350]|nr:MAG: Ribonuclease 3 [Opitutae bacterium UBA7350]